MFFSLSDDSNQLLVIIVVQLFCCAHKILKLLIGDQVLVPLADELRKDRTRARFNVCRSRFHDGDDLFADFGRVIAPRFHREELVLLALFGENTAGVTGQDDVVRVGGSGFQTADAGLDAVDPIEQGREPIVSEPPFDGRE
jgi:hypothetical protein